jgi:hypothetical protein
MLKIREKMMEMENWIEKLIDYCDVDEKNSINMKEWGKCMEIEEDEIEEKWEEMRND